MAAAGSLAARLARPGWHGRLVATAACALALVGCAKGQSSLEVTIDANGPIPDVTTLIASVTNGGMQSQTIDLVAPGQHASIPPSQTFTLVFDADRAGPTRVDVQARDAANALVGQGSGSVELVPGALALLHVTLGGTAPVDAGADLAMSATPDLAMPDAAVESDLAMSDLATADLATPDLAMFDLMPLADLRLPPPTLTACSPSKGPTTGGTSVTCTGSNLFGAGAISFGAASGVVNSVATDGHSLVATTPASPGTLGPVDVQVVADGGPATLAKGFSYFAGTVSFGSPTTVATAAAGRYLAVGDVNGDGYPEFVFNDDTSLNVALNNHQGGFQVTSGVLSFSSPLALALARVGSDPNVDLVVADNAGLSDPSMGIYGTLDVASGDGKGGFAGPSKWRVVDIASLAVGDLDGDGVVDVAAAAGSGPIAGSVNLFQGTSTGSLNGKTSYGVPTDVYGVAIGDFDGDGRLDIATSSASAGNVTARYNSGLFTFVGAKTLAGPSGASYKRLAAADLDGNGFADVAAANLVSAGGVSIFPSLGSGLWGNRVDLPGPAGTWGVTVLDLNGDGVPDLAATGSSASTVGLYVGKGDGTFTSQSTTSASGCYDLGAADFDRDGRPDLVAVCSTGVIVLMNRSH